MSDDYLRPLPDPDPWRTRALCRPDNRPESHTTQQWTDIFYPVLVERPRKNRPDPYETARLICAQCPVADDCLADAMAEEARATVTSRHGMRGGLTPRERHRLPWRVCRECGERFATTVPSVGMAPALCSAACRRVSRDRTIARQQDELKASRVYAPTVCACGFEAANGSGLVTHRRRTHGDAA